MTALACDICGGKLAMSAGGIAVCDSCGMEHTKDRMQEKIQEIKGTVVVDNSHMIDNYFTLAENAYEADNKAECEMYCNKIIEIDPTLYKAWFLKGKSAGWQSSVDNVRFDEAANCFAKAIELAPENETENMETQATDEMKDLALALIGLRGQRFSEYPDEDEANGFMNDMLTILNAANLLLDKSGVGPSGFVEDVASIINQSVVVAWSEIILPEYVGDENRPDKFDYEQFLERIGYCTMLIEKAIQLSEDDDEEDIQRYENLIHFHEHAINSCSWDYEYDSFSQKDWYKEYSLSDEAKNYRRQLISTYRKKINQIKAEVEAKTKAEQAEKERQEKEEADRRFKEYWSEHLDEKNAFETEKSSLIEKIDLFNSEIDSIPGISEKHNIKERINKLNEEKSALGIFKFKEKKALQQEISSLENEIVAIESKMKVEESKIREQIKPLQDRVDSIDMELTKVR